MKEIDFDELANFTPKQKEACDLSDQFKYVLYGGAMGGGKSYWLRWNLIRFLMLWAAELGLKGVRVGLFSHDFPTLNDRQLSKIKYEFPSYLGEYKGQEHEFILAPRYGSGVIAFRNLDDVAKYKSAEFAAIGLEEATENDENVFNMLRTRIRWPRIVNTKFIAGTNPGGIGHDWVKKLWIDKQYEKSEKEAGQFAFVQSLATDNPHLDQSYYDQLSGLPEKMRQAFLEGSWEIFEGKVFMEWDNSKHIVAPEDRPIFPNYNRFICFDYGYAKPGCMHWIAVDYDGNLIVYRELYGTGMTYEDWITKAKILSKWDDLSISRGENENIAYMVVGLDSIRKNDQTKRSGVDVMRKIWNIPYEEAYTDRLQGLVEFHERLRVNPDTGIPGIVWYNTCKEALRTTPILIHDKHKVEDVDSDLEDHCLAGDTPILTTRGWLPIERLDGSKVTGYDVDVITLTSEDGDQLTCTPNHRILTPSGWQEAGTLTSGSPILWFSTTPPRFTERVTTGSVETTTSVMVSDSTDKYGLTPTVLSQLVSIFITATVAERTIDYRTLNSRQSISTSLIIPLTRPIGNEKQEGETLLAPADAVMTDSQGHGVVKRLSSVISAGKRGKVYDVGILHSFHGFIAANGFIAHNCYDADRYGIMSRRIRKTAKPLTPLEQKFQAWKKQDELLPSQFNKYYGNEL